MGMLRESDSKWASPIVAMRKRELREVRITQDFRELTKLTCVLQYPLPQMIDLFERLAAVQPKFLTKFDLKMGYFQLRLAEKDQAKDCFSNTQGLY